MPLNRNRIRSIPCLAILAFLPLFAATAAGYTYTHTADAPPDISWLPLGNCRGQLLVTELPANLPIINTLRAPATGKTVVNNQTILTYDYASGTSRKPGYAPSQYANLEGIQPVVSYLKNGARTTVWPIQMTPVSRQWLEESNILRTVTGNADFELTTDDFVSSAHDVLVRIFTIKNLTATVGSFRILHFLPINTAGRNNFAWEANWKSMPATNSVAYDTAGDCLVFTGKGAARWFAGADRKSSQHQCATAGKVAAEITAQGALGGADSAGPAVVEAALAYDSPQLARGAAFTVSAYIASAPASTSQDAALQQFAAVKSADGAGLRDATHAFWQNWFATGRSGQIKDAQVRKLTRRLLMVLKASCWDIGGVSAVPAELSSFYTRDSMPTPRAFALFGHWNDAKAVMLAHEAYMTTAHDMNAQNYNAEMAAKIKAGFSDATKFSNIKSFSADDPPIALFTAGEVWNISDKSDTAFLRQMWPYMKWLVTLGERNMGVMGTIAQNNGFQDDMLRWAWDRPGAGIECSYFNMLWVSGLEMASEIGTTLGQPDEAAHFHELAVKIRKNLESKFWNESRHEYAYIHVPDKRKISGGAGFDEASDGGAGRFIFPHQPNNHPWSCLAGGRAFPYWYHYASDAHARTSLDSVKAQLEPLPSGDPVTSGIPLAGFHIADFLYAQAAAKDATLAATKDWVLRNAPLGGMPEVFPTNDRSVQIWITGETACALYKYVEATNGFSGAGAKGAPVKASERMK